MATGDITILDTAAFSANSDTQACVEVRDGIIAVFYENLDAPRCATFSVDADGLLALLDEQALAGIAFCGIVFDAIKIADGIAAFTYLSSTPSPYDLDVATVAIAADGTITAAIIDSLTFSVDGYNCPIVHATGDFYAIMSVPTGTDRAWLTIVEIDNAGNIPAAITDSQLISNGFTRQTAVGIIQLADGILAIFWAQTANAFCRLETRSVNGAGAIGAVIDNDTYFTDDQVYFFPFHITGTIYGCVFRDFITDVGTLVTFNLAADGTINAVDIDTFTFVAGTGAGRQAMGKGGGIATQAVACFFYPFQDPVPEMTTFSTVEVDIAGNIAATIADRAFIPPIADLGADYNFLMQISENRYIGIWQDRETGGTGDGLVVSLDVEVATVPSVSTDPATGVVNNSALLNATLDTGGLICQGYFDWGETVAYGNRTPVQNIAAGLLEFNYTAYPLKPNTTYHFRAIATNALGTSTGADRSFTTSQVPHYASTILPEVDTRPATLVTQHTARLNGVVIEDNGVIGSTRFQWGLSTNYGSNTSWEQGYNKGDEFFVDLNNLAEGQAFHFRAQYRNQGGIYDGRDMTINTPSPLGPVTLVTDEIMQLLEAV